MGFADKLKDLGDKAKVATAEHKDQLSQAVETAGAFADRQTGGKYRDKILQATQKAEGAVEKFAGEDEPAVADHAPATDASAPQSVPIEPSSPTPPPSPGPPKLT